MGSSIMVVSLVWCYFGLHQISGGCCCCLLQCSMQNRCGLRGTVHEMGEKLPTLSAHEWNDICAALNVTVKWVTNLDFGHGIYMVRTLEDVSWQLWWVRENWQSKQTAPQHDLVGGEDTTIAPITEENVFLSQILQNQSMSDIPHVCVHCAKDI